MRIKCYVHVIVLYWLNFKEKRPLVAQLDKKLHIIIEPQVTVPVVS
jgi:hypothetical protein